MLISFVSNSFSNTRKNCWELKFACARINHDLLKITGVVAYNSQCVTHKHEYRLCHFFMIKGKTFGIDWKRHKIHICEGLDIPVYTRSNLGEFLDRRGSGNGATIVMEKSFNSFEAGDRDYQIKRAEKMGYTVLFFKSDITAMFRQEWGIDKSDENDAMVIFRIATETNTPLSPMKASLKDPEYLEKFQILAQKLMMLRREWCHYYNRKPIKKHKYIVSKIDSRHLPSYSSLSDVQKKVLCNKDKTYKVSIVITVWEAAKVAKNRKEFLRLCGLYKDGHGSIMRANLYHEGLSLHKASKSGKRLASGITPTQWCKEIRWLYHTCKQILLAQKHNEEDETSMPQCNGQGDTFLEFRMQ